VLRSGRKPPPRPAPPQLPATAPPRERIVHEVSRVDDEELRELIARVRITTIARIRPRYFDAPAIAEPPTVSSAERSSSLNRSCPRGSSRGRTAGSSNWVGTSELPFTIGSSLACLSSSPRRQDVDVAEHLERAVS